VQLSTYAAAAPAAQPSDIVSTLQVHNEGGDKRIVVTKTLPGERWLQVLTAAGCHVEVCTHPDTILSVDTISQLIGDECHGVIGQLTEDWDKKLFRKLKDAGGSAFSNYAVGYNNVNVGDATEHGIPVGNTPGARKRMRALVALRAMEGYHAW
jgi:glycerate dehydrogenase